MGWHAAASGSVRAYYGSEPGQSARSSPNFPDLDIPDNATKIMFTAMDGPAQEDKDVVFNIDHDKVGSDTRWYTGVKSSVPFDPTGCGPGQSGSCGEKGEHALYVITKNIPSGKLETDTYQCMIYYTTD